VHTYAYVKVFNYTGKILILEDLICGVRGNEKIKIASGYAEW